MNYELRMMYGTNRVSGSISVAHGRHGFRTTPLGVAHERARRRCAGRIPIFFSQRLASLLPHHTVPHKARIREIAGNILHKFAIIVCAVFLKMIVWLNGNTIWVFKESGKKCAICNTTRVPHNANLVRIRFYESEHSTIIRSVKITK